MRCASCGMENAPDSRFCGGCGARQPSSGEQRLAPTAKIPDEAPYPQQAARPAVMPQGPVSYAPPSIPPPASSIPTPAPGALSTPPPGSLVRAQSQQPAAARPASQPPGAQRPASQPPRAAPKPQLSSTSGSIVVPASRPIGLMVALLILDIGLAAAGAVLLSKGLADKEPKQTAPVEKKAAAPATNVDTPAIDRDATSNAAASSATANAAASVAASAVRPAPITAPTLEPVAKPEPAAAAREAPKRAVVDPKLADKRPEPTKVAATKPEPSPDVKPVDTKPADTKPVDTKPVDTKPNDAKPVPLVPATPQDPYTAPNTEKEIEAEAAASKNSFAECAHDHPAHGAIKIAFQVRYDGRVINAAAVENTTGSPDLARCLVTEISSWQVSAHNGATINMLRPFTYP